MRILPPLPATAQLSATATAAGTPAVGRILPAQVITPLAGDLYEVLAGQLTLQIRSTLPLLRGQPLQLQLQQGAPGQPARWVMLPTTAASEAMPAGSQGTTLPSAGRGQPLPLAASAATLPMPTTLPAAPRIPVPLASLTAPAATLAASLRQAQAGESQRPAVTPATVLPSRQLSHEQPGDRLAPAMPVPDSAAARSVQPHLQTLLPRQQDPTRLAALLQALQPALASAPSSPLHAAARQLLASLPNAEKLTTPAAIMQMLQSSGLLHEAMPAGPATPDLKAALLQLLPHAPAELPVSHQRTAAAAGHVQPLRHDDSSGLLQKLEPQSLLLLLAAEAEPVLSRLETHQLMHLQQRDGQHQQWLFELPMRHGQNIDVWQLHIDQDERGQAEGDATPGSSWTLTLSVDFPETGALMIRLGLTGSRLHAHFHAESAATHERIKSWLPELQEVLMQRGVPEPTLTCQRGLPHRDNRPPALSSVLAVSA